MKNHPGRNACGNSRGFTLIEVLIGVVIGLIGIVAMFQVLTVWDSVKRTTASGSDAQVAGTVAMFKLERDLRHAGMGFGMAAGAAAPASGAGVLPVLAPIMGCTVSAYHADLPARNFTFALRPIEIIDGASGASDVIRILYGNSSFFVSSQGFTASTANSKKTQSRNGFQRGDAVIVAGNNPTDCALIEVTDDTNADTLTFDHTPAAYTNFYTGAAGTAVRFNPSAGTGVTFSSGFLYNLGPSPQLNEWKIQDEMLVKNDVLYENVDSQAADNIVNLQAQYGIDTNSDGQIADDGTTTFCTLTNEWCATAPADWTKLLAVRIALLSRSQQYEKLAVTPDAPAAVDGLDRTPRWAGGLFAMINPPDGTDWRHYRYRVYEKVIPLRNMIWGTAP